MHVYRTTHNAKPATRANTNLSAARARQKNVSNCPDCALSNDPSRQTRIYKQNEMDADHVTAWSKGGSTGMKNCQMLCRYHNHSKRNS